MILFCDTSALLKLYVDESHSAATKALAYEAEAVAVCRIAWAEAFAALSRRAREVPVDAPAVAAVKRALANDWPRYLVIDVTQEVVERAGDFADAFALRGYDSVQLAAAHIAAERTQTEVRFAAFDGRLSKAARILGMPAPFAETP
jgi:predicted nucleic acid-binding protein